MNPNRPSAKDILEEFNEISQKKPTEEQLKELADCFPKVNPFRDKLSLTFRQTYLDHLEVYEKIDLDILAENLIDILSEFVYNNNCGDFLVQEFVNLLEE